MSYLVHTHVLCEASKPKPDASVLQWLADHDAELAISTLSLGEMLKGIDLMDRGKRRQEIEQWYQRIERWAAGRILPVDFAVSHTWAMSFAKHQRAGRKLPATDSLIAATALHHQLADRLSIRFSIGRPQHEFPRSRWKI